MQPSSVPQVLSVNVGQPRAVVWKGRMVVTGIFKEPVAGRIAIKRLNLEGDRQADLTVHGWTGEGHLCLSSGVLPVLAGAIS
jgi:MOSC domain-containing protein YiiM